MDRVSSPGSLFQSRVLVLDGAVGTELERRGVPTPRPLWSAAALLTHPQVVEQIHRDYVEAGAEIIVANTFRTNVRTLRAGVLERGAELNRLALELARKVAQRHEGTQARRHEGGGQSSALPVLVAASVAPVEDCYSPQLVPDEAMLDDEHAQMMAWLKAAGPDLVWIETMNTVREARAAARAAANAGLPCCISFVTRENGDLLSGEPLEAAVAAVEPFGPIALGLNCIPPDGMTRNLPRLRSATQSVGGAHGAETVGDAHPTRLRSATRKAGSAHGTLLAAYAHINNPTPIRGWSFSQQVTPEEYAKYARRWIELGASIVGGCCGTTPAHIAAVRATVDMRAVTRET